MASANSFGVTSSIRLPAHSSGRSNGVFASSFVVKTPCTSGSPHGVFGGVNPLAMRAATNAFTASAPGTLAGGWNPLRACPARSLDESRTTTAAVTAAGGNIRRERFITDLLTVGGRQ
jgi:hypothetical protein